MRQLTLVLLLVACGCVARAPVGASSESAGSSVEVRSTPAEVMPHQELSDADYFRMINESRGKSSFVNAVGLVRVTNALIPLGQAAVLRILRAYLTQRGHSDDDTDVDDFPSRVFWVAQLAFTMPDGKGFRCPGVGDFGTVIAEKSEHWSLYPFCLCEDLPLNVSCHLMLLGCAESPFDYLDDVEEMGVLRRRLLRPADNPLEIAERFLDSDAWKDIRWEGKELGHTWFISESWIRTMVRKQALEALEDVYDPGENTRSLQSHAGMYDWNKHLKRVRKLALYWDEKAQRYRATQ